MSCYDTVLNTLPILFILVLMSWSYYAYVIELCTYTIEDSRKLTLYLIVYHFLLFMFLWTYFQTMCTDIAIVPEEYKVSRVLYEKVRIADTNKKKNDLLLEFCHTMQLNLVTRNEDGYIRFCIKCLHIKPDRAHHCRKCGTCILKMDHHCPWINNCIGFSNYKYFTLFLCYNLLYCMFYAGTTLEYFITFWKEPVKNYSTLHVVIGFIVALSFGILVLVFSCYHMSQISKNETTLEAMGDTKFVDSNEDLTFNIGVCKNFEEVFGDQWYLWFIPVWSSLGDGLHFPIRHIF